MVFALYLQHHRQFCSTVRPADPTTVISVLMDIARGAERIEITGPVLSRSLHWTFTGT